MFPKILSFPFPCCNYIIYTFSLVVFALLCWEGSGHKVNFYSHVISSMLFYSYIGGLVVIVGCMSIHHSGLINNKLYL